MSSIDERIVEMKFNNGQFQKGIDQTAESLDKLKQSLNLEGAGTALEKIASKFNWLSVAGATGLVSLTNAAINAGKSIYDYYDQQSYALFKTIKVLRDTKEKLDGTNEARQREKHEARTAQYTGKKKRVSEYAIANKKRGSQK